MQPPLFNRGGSAGVADLVAAIPSLPTWQPPDQPDEQMVWVELKNALGVSLLCDLGLGGEAAVTAVQRAPLAKLDITLAL